MIIKYVNSEKNWLDLAKWNKSGARGLVIFILCVSAIAGAAWSMGLPLAYEFFWMCNGVALIILFAWTPFTLSQREFDIAKKIAATSGEVDTETMTFKGESENSSWSRTYREPAKSKIYRSILLVFEGNTYITTINNEGLTDEQRQAIFTKAPLVTAKKP